MTELALAAHIDAAVASLETLDEARRLKKQEYNRERDRRRRDEMTPEERRARAKALRLRYKNDREFREKERERQRVKNRAMRHKLDAPERMLHSARFRARAQGLAFDLTIGYVRQLMPVGGRCPVLGFRMLLDDEMGRTPSLDRIVPSLGYVEGNVRVISHRANTIKSDATIDEVRKVLQYMEAAHAR